MNTTRVGLAAASALALLTSQKPAAAATETFETGTLIIPMDVVYQDSGMLKAFGLLDKLLRAGVPVQWVIKTPKKVVDAAKGQFEDDFTASATDYKTSAVIASHGYRGGPFVIRAADAALAKPIITAWQATNTTAVHVATAPFTGFLSRTLVAAPRIAVFADGNEKIAFEYLNAAGIPDKNGALWAVTSPDVLTPAKVAGPTTTNHADGALFRPSGQPAFCEIMTMHWKVGEPEAAEVSAELASFLKFPTHVNAECQAVNALEGAPPVGGRSNFVASKGFAWPAPAQPATVEFLNSALPFAQMDGPFKSVGGSEPAYALAAGSTYYDTGIVMVKGAGKAVGQQDVWMTGYANTGAGVCPITDPQCIIEGKSLGKVSYLGGHAYDVRVPISTNPTTQGARLFLNSLYEAGCVTAEGRGEIEILKTAPAVVTSGTVTYILDVTNFGKGPALDIRVTDALPAGSTFVSATKGGTFSAGVVTWMLGDLAAGTTTALEVTLTLPAFGTFTNVANAQYTVGVTNMTAKSNVASTTWIDCAGDAASSCYCVDGGGCDADVADGGSDVSGVSDTSTLSDATLADGALADSATLADGTLADSGSSGDDTSSSTGDGSTGDASSGDASSGDASSGDASSGDDTGASTGDDTGASTGDDTGAVTDGALAGDSGDPSADPDSGTDAAGGCGCQVPQRARGQHVIAALALAVLWMRRRRR